VVKTLVHSAPLCLMPLVLMSCVESRADLPYARNGCDPRRCAAYRASQTEVDAQHRLIFRTGVPHECAGGDPCHDDDRDGLDDVWEGLVLQRLTPQVRMDPEDQLLVDDDAAFLAIGRVTPAPGRRVRVFVVLAYSHDYGRCGSGGHAGDTERVVMDLAPHPRAGKGAWIVDRVYTAAHEGVDGDASRRFEGAELRELEYVRSLDSGEPHWLVYSTRDKHATHVSSLRCERAATALCLEEDCAPGEPGAIVAGPSGPPRADDLLPRAINAGEPDAPLIRALGPFGFPGEDAWAPRPFCGGLDLGGRCADSPGAKMTLDPFALLGKREIVGARLAAREAVGCSIVSSWADRPRSSRWIAAPASRACAWIDRCIRSTRSTAPPTSSSIARTCSSPPRAAARSSSSCAPSGASRPPSISRSSRASWATVSSITRCACRSPGGTGGCAR
jgi:hypothetical protein